MHKDYFYGRRIDPDAEKKMIQKILSKYRSEPVTEALKQKIFDELTHAKHNGKISIPFKVVLRKSIPGMHRPYIEVILDTKV